MDTNRAECRTVLHLDLSLCTIDYKVIDNTPIVFLFCRDRNGKRHIITDSSFRPYFYIRAMDLNKPRAYRLLGTPTKPKKPVIRMESGFKGLTRQINDLVKIVCDIPANVKKLRDKLQASSSKHLSIMTFEADIFFYLRYLIDKGIKTGIRYYPSLKRIEPIEAPSRYRALYIDLEVKAKDAYELKKHEAPIVIVGFYDSFKKEYKVFYLDNKGMSRKLSKEYFVVCESEKELLNRTISYISKTQPDVLVSFTSFDMLYLIKRCKANRIDYTKISPIKKAWIKEDDIHKPRVMIGGMEYIDIGEVYKTLFPSHAKYETLNEICVRELGEKYSKRSLNKSVFEAWSLDPASVIFYNLRDVFLIKELNEKLGLLEALDTIRRKAGIRLLDALYPSRVADVFYLRLLHNKIVLPTRPIEKPEHKKELEYEGAQVFECKIGVYHNVVCLDFKAVYPSTIRAFNIGYNTLHPLGTLIIDKEHRFLDPSIEKSWTVQILDEIEPLLDENKKLLNKAKRAGDEKLISRLKARRLGLKAIVHGNYGFYGFKGNIDEGLPASRLFSIKIAEAITKVPREILRDGLPKIAKQLGYEIVYGDTDSVFIQLKGENIIDEARHLKDTLQAKVREYIRGRWNIDPTPFVLDIDDIYKTIIFLAKKRYTGETVEGNIVNKGIEIVRRDQSKLTEETQRELISLILSNKIDKIPSFIREQIRKIETYPLEMIGIPAILKKRVSSFKTSSIHLKAFVFSTQYLGIPLSIGERFFYVYIKPANIQARVRIGDRWRTFTPEAIAFTSSDQIQSVMTAKVDSTLLSYFSSNSKVKVKIEIDKETMIEKTIKAKVKDFLKLVNLEWSDIVGEKERYRQRIWR